MSYAATLTWRPRRRPLGVSAAIGCGKVALAWAKRLLREPDPARWRAAGGAHTLLLLGQDLPWVEGLVYLGVDAAAPALLLPTLLEPCWPLDLLEVAVGRSALALPCAVLQSFPGRPGEPFLFSASAARQLDAARLEAWLAEQEHEAP